jgi:hypothetical protein
MERTFPVRFHVKGDIHYVDIYISFFRMIVYQIFGGVLPACWHQHRGYIRFGSGLCILRAGSNEGIEGESEAVRIFKVHEYQRSNPSVGVEQWVRER